MGRNYYLNNYGYEWEIYQDCHVGKNDWLDLIAICKSFRETIRNRMDYFKVGIGYKYQKYLSQVSKAVQDKETNKDSMLVHNPEFNNLPQMIIEIYDYITKEYDFCASDDADAESYNDPRNHVMIEHKLVARDEYEVEYDFRNHITVHCIDANQKEFGGLRYSTRTGFF